MKLTLLTILASVVVVVYLAGQEFDPAQTARAAVERLVKGDFAAVVATFDEKVRALMPEQKLREVWALVASQAGALKEIGEARVSRKGEYQIVVLPGEFENTKADIQVVFNASGQISGFNIRPAAVPGSGFTDAPYVARDRFTERQLTVDAGGWPLAATLSMPNGKGPFAAVLLVHGSGPGDRDQSVGALKPFRDLAHGLASRGIAVLRYDKRTRVHAARMKELKTMTVALEVVDDAVAATELLGTMAGVDPKRVFVAGLSMGGMLAPRIAAASGDTLAGLIVLAGAATPLEQAILNQTRYLAMLDGSISAEEQKQIDAAEALVKQVQSVTATDAPVSVLGASVPASYFVDLRGYDPPAAAVKIQKPMLVLQGERDFQVTMEDFARWTAALGTRQDVTLKSYPGLNHLFVEGKGQSTPVEYNTPAHASEEVIRDIANWISNGKIS